MKNVEVLINPITSQVILNKKRLGLNYENLQGKIVVTFDGDFIDGIAYLEIERNGEKGYLEMAKEDNAYTLEIKSSLLNKVGQINMQVRITEEQQGNELPVWKSNIFYLNVEKAINSTAEIPDEYPEWIDIANAKLAEMDNLNINASKTGHITTIAITKKDGSVETTQVLDGEPGPQGEPGVPGAIKFLIVQELPTTGIQTDTMYLVPKGDPSTTDLYDEYIYANNNWELIGEKQIQVDLSDYYTKNETNGLLNNKQNVMQYSTMPTASATNLGQIAQYTGTTNQNYTCGYFYQVVSDGALTPTYSWSKIEYGVNEEIIHVLNFGERLVYDWQRDSISSNFLSEENKAMLIDILNDLIDTQEVPSNGHLDYYFVNKSDDALHRYKIELVYNQNTQTFERFDLLIQYDLANDWSLQYGDKYLRSQSFSIDTSNRHITNIYFGYSSSKITYNLLPTNNNTSYTPQDDYNPCTKKYADDKFNGATAQYSTMPTAASTLLNKIVQYVGTTDNNYTNGHFYKCVSDEAQPPVYSWEEVSLGGSTATKGVYHYYPTDSGTYIYFHRTGSNCIRFKTTTDKELFLAILKQMYINNDYQNPLLVWHTYDNGYSKLLQINGRGMNTTSNFSIAIGYNPALYDEDCHIYRGSNNNNGQIAKVHTFTITVTNGEFTDIQYLSGGTSTMYLPISIYNTYAFTPSGDYNPANKKYVDDSVSSVQTQYSTMPTAASSNVGQIVQYTGTTDSSYTNGHFYECVLDGSTYKWSEVSLGGGGGSGDTNCGYYYIELGSSSYMVYGQNYMAFYLDATDQAALATIIEDALGKGNKAILLNVKQSYGIWTYRLHIDEIDLTQSTTYFSFQQVLCAGDVYELAYSLYNAYGTQQVIVACTVTDGHITAMSYSSSDANTMGKYLPIGNTAEFTPTASYDPVPKTYADKLIESSTIVRRLNLSTAIMGSFTSMNRNYVTGNECKPLLLALINDAIAKGLSSFYFIGSSDDYYMMYKMVVPSTTSGTQATRLIMYPDPTQLVKLKYNANYAYYKSINIVFTNNVATDLSVPSSGYTQDPWNYLSVNNTTAFTPTSDYQPCPKKYADDLPTTYSGYDATKTQILKNINGTLTWVDE